MYELNIQRSLIAHHFLTVPNCGPENEWHAHTYGVEVRLEGESLNAHGYLVDIVALEDHVSRLTAYYRNSTLNDLPEFEGLNPSIEHFARILCDQLASRLAAPNVQSLAVRIFEDDVAWAGYRRALGS